MSIKEIMKGATDPQRGQILTAIVGDGVAVSTAYAYCNGNRRPKYLYQVRIQKYIKKYIGMDVPLSELFPEKPRN